MKLFMSDLWLRFISGKNKQRIIIELSIFILFFLMFYITMTLNYIYPWNLVNIALYAILSLMILAWCLLYQKLIFDYFFFILIIFNLLIPINSILNGIFYFDTTVLLLSATCFIFYQILRIKKYRVAICSIFGIAGICFLLSFTIFYFDSIIKLDGARIGADFGDLNIVGYIFLYLFCYYIYVGLIKKRWLLIIPAVYSVILIFVTGSRSALLIAILVLIIAIFAFFGRKKIQYSILVTIVAACCFVLILFLPPMANLRTRLFSSIETLFSINILNSYEPRLFLFIEGIEFCLKRPFLGYGGVFTFGNYSFSGHFSHNNIVELWFNYGFIEVILFQLLIFIPLYKAIKRNTSDKKLIIMFATAIFLIQFFYANYTIKIDYIVMAIMMGSANEVDNSNLFEIYMVKNKNNQKYFKISI